MWRTSPRPALCSAWPPGDPSFTLGRPSGVASLRANLLVRPRAAWRPAPRPASVGRSLHPRLALPSGDPAVACALEACCIPSGEPRSSAAEVCVATPCPARSDRGLCGDSVPPAVKVALVVCRVLTAPSLVQPPRRAAVHLNFSHHRWRCRLCISSSSHFGMAIRMMGIQLARGHFLLLLIVSTI